MLFERRKMNNKSTKGKKKLPKNIREKPNGKFEIRLQANGVKYDKSADTLKEAKIILNNIQRKVLIGKTSKLHSATLNDVYELWKLQKIGLKPNTFDNYVYMYEKFVKDTIGKRRVTDITRTKLKIFYKDLVETERIKITTADNIQTVIHQVLDVAVEENIIEKNPSDKALKEFKLSKELKSTKIVIMDREQRESFYNYLLNTRYNRRWYRVYRFLEITGLRVGEFGALQKEDVDYDKKTLTINKTIFDAYDANKKTYYGIHDPKTFDGNRTIPLTDEALDLILEELNYQKIGDIRSKSKIGNYKDFLFLNLLGKFYTDTSLNKRLYELRDLINIERKAEGKAELPRLSCHKFRHMCNNNMMESGVSVETRMAYLGQKDVSVNIKTYIHVSEEEMRRAAETVSKNGWK